MEDSLSGAFFTRVKVEHLFARYAASVFAYAVRELLRSGVLDREEKSVLSSAVRQTKADPAFICRSCFIYLCNGILSAESAEALFRWRRQLILELAIRLLERDATDGLPLRRDGEHFSLLLNWPLKGAFDSIGKEGKQYQFFREGSEVFRLAKDEAYEIERGIFFLKADHNPFNQEGDHPDEVFVSYDLGSRPAEEWVRQFRAAYSMIKEKVPDIHHEITPFLDEVVPHGYMPGKQSSSSYSKSPGILYLSYTDDDVTQAEAIIHEVHHTIFNIIHWRHKLYDNDLSLRYYSAYRPDARHIHGCFLGLHAFVAVQNFYRRLAEQEDLKAAEHFFFFYLKNAKVIRVIRKYADLTEEGRLLFEDILRRYQADDPAFSELSRKHPGAEAEIRRRVEEHLQKAKMENEGLLC